MEVRFICVGKSKEDYFAKACAEYKKMLSRFFRVCEFELPDAPLQNVKSAAEEAEALKKEGARVLEKLKGFVIVLDIGGKKMDSVAFAHTLERAFAQGGSTVSFVVGSSLGLSEEIKKRADLRLSFSDMTLPHRLFRVVLYEQVFRAFKIINQETYHK